MLGAHEVKRDNKLATVADAERHRVGALKEVAQRLLGLLVVFERPCPTDAGTEHVTARESAGEHHEVYIFEGFSAADQIGSRDITDVEARNDTPSADSGRLKDPILNIAAFVRALGGSISPTNRQPFSFTRMSQTPLAPTTVFGFYSPLYHVPRSATLIGPEFQIYGPTEAGLRGNYFWLILSNPGADFPISIAPFITLAGDTIALIDAVDQTLLYGRMPTAMRQSLADAINAESDATTKARTALYLTALSGFYAVHH